ncbi:unnamed protein product, partial [Rotaria sp. Silwood1]
MRQFIPSIPNAKKGTHSTLSTLKQGRLLNDSGESTSGVSKQHKPNEYTQLS